MKQAIAFVLLISTASLLCGFQQGKILAPILQGAPAAAGGGKTLAFVQLTQGGNNFGGTTATVAMGTNLAAGHNLIACAFWSLNTGSGITATFTDSQSKTYSTDALTRTAQIGTATYGEIGIECGHSTQVSTAAADTVTCTYSSAVNSNFCIAWEVDPNSGTIALDQHNSGTGTGGAAYSAGSISPVQANTFAISDACVDIGAAGGPTLTAGSGWTPGTQFGGNDVCFPEYQSLATTATVTGSVSTSNSSLQQWFSMVANYKSN